MRVRPATPDDLERIVEGNLAIAQETEGLALDRARLTDGVRAVLEGRASGLYRLAERDGAVLGQLMVTFEWSDWRNADLWWIQSVYVWPEHRRQGVFQTLYRALEGEALRAGASGLRLYVEVDNARAHATYGALGMDGDRYRVFERMFTAR